MANNNISSHNAKPEGLTALLLGTSWKPDDPGKNLQHLTETRDYLSLFSRSTVTGHCE